MDKNKESAIMRILKVHEIRIPLYKTPLGDLELKRQKDSDTYIFTLDSVDLDKDKQKELNKLYEIS